jgi:hypothetical protein
VGLAHPRRAYSDGDGPHDGLRTPLDQLVPETISREGSFKDAVEYLRDQMNCDLDVDWAAIDPARKLRDAMVSVDFKGMTRSEVFYKLLRDSGERLPAVVGAEGNVIIVTSPAEMEQRIMATHQRRLATVDSDALRMLARPLGRVMIENTSVAEAVSVLAKVAGVAITTDPETLDEAGVNNSTVVRLLLRNADVGTALDLALAEAHAVNGILTYVVDKTGIRVVHVKDDKPDSADAVAARLMVLGDGYAELGCTSEAEEKYNRIVAEYPTSSVAKRAAANLKKLDGKRH